MSRHLLWGSTSPTAHPFPLRYSCDVIGVGVWSLGACLHVEKERSDMGNKTEPSGTDMTWLGLATPARICHKQCLYYIEINKEI